MTVTMANVTGTTRGEQQPERQRCQRTLLHNNNAKETVNNLTRDCMTMHQLDE